MCEPLFSQTLWASVDAPVSKTKLQISDVTKVLSHANERNAAKKFNTLKHRSIENGGGPETNAVEYMTLLKFP